MKWFSLNILIHACHCFSHTHTLYYPLIFFLSLFSQRVLGGWITFMCMYVWALMLQCTVWGSGFSFCTMWVVLIWHQVSLPIEPSFQLYKVLPICFQFDSCRTLPLNTVLDQVPYACWSILYHWPSCILQQCFCVFRKKKDILYLYSTREKTWRNKTKAIAVSHSCPPIWPFFV